VSEPVVEVTDAAVTLGGRPVLRGVSLTVRRGETVAVLGANGSGKSTLVRGVLGAVPLTAGSVRLFGVALPAFRDWARIGYVPQRLGAGGGVPATVREVVASGRLARRSLLRPRSRRARLADRDAVAGALAAVGLADRAGDQVASLSGGQQQRVLIARALCGEPDLYVLDEPNAGVDAASQAAFADTVRGLVGNGATLVVVLHEAGPLASLIDRAVVLEHGRVVHDGAMPRAADHHADPGHDHVHPHAAEDRSAGVMSLDVR
jgi:zinc transport system ATP-binding protein